MTVLKYPLDIDGSCDYVQFSFSKYEPPTQNGSLKTVYNPEQKFTRTGNTIILPMPGDIGTSFTGAWSGKNTTSLAQAALGAVAKPIADTLVKGDLSGSLKSILDNPGNAFKGTAKALGDDFIRYLGDSFGQLPGLGANLQANDVLQLTTGTILNPNTELLYGGNSLRTHSYSFKMIPQSDDEADSVLNIVKSFREACMPPAKGAIFGKEGRNFIGIPDLCQVTFLNKDFPQGNPYLPKYKLSGITSINISYVTEGNYMSFRDGKPIGIQLTISLTETKLVFREDLINGVAR